MGVANFSHIWQLRLLLFKAFQKSLFLKGRVQKYQLELGGPCFEELKISQVRRFLFIMFNSSILLRIKS